MGREARVRQVIGPELTIQWALFCVDFVRESGDMFTLQHVLHTLPTQPKMDSLAVALCVTGPPNSPVEFQMQLVRPNGDSMDFPEHSFTLTFAGASHLSVKILNIELDLPGAMIAQFRLNGRVQTRKAILQIFPAALVGGGATTTH